MHPVVADVREITSAHPSDEELELYSLGTLREAAVPMLEQHLLVCAECQDRSIQMDAHVQAMQAECRAIRLKEPQRRTMCQASGSSR
jgi:anti-sigma factor ChrR (cupin superfamily)